MQRECNERSVDFKALSVIDTIGLDNLYLQDLNQEFQEEATNMYSERRLNQLNNRNSCRAPMSGEDG